MIMVCRYMGEPRQNYHVEFDDETNAVLDDKKVSDSHKCFRSCKTISYP